MVVVVAVVAAVVRVVVVGEPAFFISLLRYGLRAMGDG